MTSLLKERKKGGMDFHLNNSFLGSPWLGVPHIGPKSFKMVQKLDSMIFNKFEIFGLMCRFFKMLEENYSKNVGYHFYS